MRIAVIGGGVFGTMIAIRLAEFGHSVSLLERLPALMQGTSSLANRCISVSTTHATKKPHVNASAGSVGSSRSSRRPCCPASPTPISSRAKDR
jgi:succinate dehydrogenase/fumarate reductase flavoprotein subunit